MLQTQLQKLNGWNIACCIFLGYTLYFRNVSFFIAITSIFNAQGRIASLPLFVCIKRFCSELSRNF